jgi:hypothetical protein
MNREQLIKKMLAIKSYLDRQKEAQAKQAAGYDNNKNSSSAGRNTTSTSASAKGRRDVPPSAQGEGAPRRSPRGVPSGADARTRPSEVNVTICKHMPEKSKILIFA